ncbi:hypothetical protein [Nocardia jinanensis]|uniref:Uncharacterized protein n=1 Tax=Nocardia jinanensis TaxID=382504 RepID=A0A917RW38_9NOCA|nr:hypothetical protein [Nocardia jinanensis]GGL38675.1 hypothetical protein GCM10011588_61580 [Nocardia jinanensis]
MADGFITPESSGDTPVSTPLHRVAGRLQSALPDGWRVEVVAVEDPMTGDQPVLRALLTTD